MSKNRGTTWGYWVTMAKGRVKSKMTLMMMMKKKMNATEKKHSLFAKYNQKRMETEQWPSLMSFAWSMPFWSGVWVRLYAVSCTSSVTSIKKRKKTHLSLHFIPFCCWVKRWVKLRREKRKWSNPNSVL